MTVRLDVLFKKCNIWKNVLCIEKKEHVDRPGLIEFMCMIVDLLCQPKADSYITLEDLLAVKMQIDKSP